MNPNGVVNHHRQHHRGSPSADRFLGVFSSPPPSTTAVSYVSDEELNEDDVFWAGDFSERDNGPSPPPLASELNHRHHHFRQPGNSGILAALPEDDRKPKSNSPVLYRKPSAAVSLSPSASPSLSSASFSSASSSRAIPSVPKPELPQSVKKFQQSAPVNVPVFPRKARNANFDDVDVSDDDDDEMLPPHEIVARGSAKTTFSVLEGKGRTLKGRDLRLVRNAVWRQTGFLD